MLYKSHFFFGGGGGYLFVKYSRLCLVESRVRNEWQGND